MSRAATSPAQREALTAAMRRVAAGDQAALGEVYDRTSAKLFGICLRILADRSEAEDALQDVYESVWRQAKRFDPGRASPITWLATLARNRAIDRLRSGRRSRLSEPVDAAADIADPSPGALAGLEAAEERSRIADCIAELDAKAADAIRSAFFAGHTYAELATRAGVPLGTMKSWVRRALMKLKECLER